MLSAMAASLDEKSTACRFHSALAFALDLSQSAWAVSCPANGVASSAKPRSRPQLRQSGESVEMENGREKRWLVMARRSGVRWHVPAPLDVRRPTRPDTESTIAALRLGRARPWEASRGSATSDALVRRYRARPR